MKELFNTLSNVSQFFKGNRFIYMSHPKGGASKGPKVEQGKDEENPLDDTKGSKEVSRDKLTQPTSRGHSMKKVEDYVRYAKAEAARLRKLDPKNRPVGRLATFQAEINKYTKMLEKAKAELAAKKAKKAPAVKKVVKKPVEKEHLVITRDKLHHVNFKDTAAEKTVRLKDLDFVKTSFIKIQINSDKYHPGRAKKAHFAYRDPNRGGNYYFMDGRRERVKIGNSDIFVPGTMLGESDQKKYGAMAKKAVARDKARRRRRPRPAPAPAPAPAPPKSPEEIEREKDIAAIAKVLKTDDITQGQADSAAESLYKSDPTLDPTVKQDMERIQKAIKHFTVLNYKNRKEELKKSKDVTKAVLDTYTWLVNNPKAKKYIGKELGTQLNPRTAEKYWVLAHVKLLTFNKHQRDIIAKKGHRLTAKEAMSLGHVVKGGKFLDGKNEILPVAGREWADPFAPKNYGTVPGTGGGKGVTKMAFV